VYSPFSSPQQALLPFRVLFTPFAIGVNLDPFSRARSPWRETIFCPSFPPLWPPFFWDWLSAPEALLLASLGSIPTPPSPLEERGSYRLSFLERLALFPFLSIFALI